MRSRTTHPVRYTAALALCLGLLGYLSATVPQTAARMLDLETDVSGQQQNLPFDFIGTVYSIRSVESDWQ